MTKKTYKEDKKKLKKFFKKEETNPEKIIEGLLSSVDMRTTKIIYNRYSLNDKHGFPGYKTIHENPWYKVKELVPSQYSEQWISKLFNKGLRMMRHPTRKKHLYKFEKELRQFVDKEGISDKSVYLYIDKYFLFEDTLFEEVTGRSLREYYLYR